MLWDQKIQNNSKNLQNKTKDTTKSILATLKKYENAVSFPTYQ